MLPTDSSVRPHRYTTGAHEYKENTIRTGIVREEILDEDYGMQYVVEVFDSGRQIPISCIVAVRFGGVHNFEEYNLRPWLQNSSGDEENPYGAVGYEMRAGDTVIVALIDGNGREGIIIGALPHPARTDYGKKINLEKGKPAYYSRFNGIDKTIFQDGQYKTTYNGLPINDEALSVPPSGAVPPEPEFDPSTSGSYYGYDAEGSFIASSSEDIFLKLDKTKHLYVKIKDTVLEINEQAHGIVAETISRSASKYTIKTKQLEAHESLKISLKATQMAIGNDQFELFDGLIQLIDALGGLTVTSPVGTCTPLMSAPTWAAQIVPLQVKIQTLKTSLESVDDFDAESGVSSEIGD